MNAIFTTPARAQTPDHALSPSQVTTFIDCNARWFFSKVLQLPDPRNGALALGTAVHATAAALMRAKQQDGELPDIGEANEVYEWAIGAELETAELAPDENAEEITATGRKIVEVWHAQVAPHQAPAAVELAIAGQIGGVEVHAIADLITTDNIVIDLKTSAKKPGAIRPDHAFQLATYAMLTKKTTARLVTITKAEKPSVVQHTMQIGDQERKYAEAIYPVVSAAMQTGIYPPRRSSLLCSRKHCPFWRECIAEFGGDVQ